MDRILVEVNLDNRCEDVENVMERAKVVKAEAASDIANDVRKMINNSTYSDVVFRCTDGVGVHACRLFLVARSEVLHRMLLNGMAESQSSEITLQEVSSTALLPVMEFLYTGTLQEHAPKDWKNAYDVIGAARFFLLERLELLVIDYLLHDIAEVGVDIEAIAKFLSITVEFLGMFGETVEPVAHELVCILGSRSLKLEHLRALTANAFSYLLEKTKNKVTLSEFLSQEVVLRLRNIVLWCACHEFAMAPDAVPAEFESILKVWERSSYERVFMASEQPEIGLTTRQALASSVKEYLHFVNFQQIPPSFLVNNVEPMDILPSSIITDALRFHALQKTSNTRGGTSGWLTSLKTQEIYRMDIDGSVIKQRRPGIGFAKYDFGMSYEADAVNHFEWSIVIEEVCDGFIEIGMHCDPYDEFTPKDGKSLSEQPGGWALRMDPRGLFITNRIMLCHDQCNFIRVSKDRSQLTYGKHYGQKDCKITVCLDLDEATCKFSVDNVLSELLVWSSVPRNVTCFPAVSLGAGSGGRVRITGLEDADYFVNSDSD